MTPYDGDLVRLRDVRPEDADAQHRWFTDPEVTYYLALRYPLSREAIAERLAAEATFANPRFSVERRDTGALIGYVALRDVTPETRKGELDLVVGEKALWGRGYGTDTVNTLCRWAFEQAGLHRVHLWVFAEHAAAIAAYEKAGFTREGVARDRLYKHGRYHDCVLMARFAW